MTCCNKQILIVVLFTMVILKLVICNETDVEMNNRLYNKIIQNIPRHSPPKDMLIKVKSEQIFIYITLAKLTQVAVPDAGDLCSGPMVSILKWVRLYKILDSGMTSVWSDVRR